MHIPKYFKIAKSNRMSQTKDFTAVVQSGITGYLIQVKGKVNCGKLSVMPTLAKKEPQGFNIKILLLDVYPASDDSSGNFNEAEYTENIEDKNTYTEVQLVDPSGKIILALPVTQAHSRESVKE